jgi:drug/metabolite transporter (DMT)-like permease
VAVILGMLVLNEELSWRTLVGGAMIIAGIGFIVVRKDKPGQEDTVKEAAVNS